MTESFSSFIQNDLNVANFQTETSRLQSLNSNLKQTNPNDKKLLETSQQFESVFIHKLLQIMDKTIQRSDLMHAGQAEDVFRDMFYQEIAKDISKNPNVNFGLGKQIYSQLSQYE